MRKKLEDDTTRLTFNLNFGAMNHDWRHSVRMGRKMAIGWSRLLGEEGKLDLR